MKATTRASGRRATLWPNLALAVGGVIAALLLAEAGLHLFDGLTLRLRGDRLALPHDVRYEIRNPSNPRLARHIVHTKNALGFRGPAFPLDPSRHLIAFAVGGSTTECYYLSDGRDWPTVLGRRLQCAFPALWLNNAGLDGHSTFGHRLLLEQRLLRLHPQILLFLVGINDVARQDLGGPEDVARPDSSTPLVDRLARHSVLVALVQNAWRAERARMRDIGHTALDLKRSPTLPFHRRRLRRALARHRALFLPAYRERLDLLVERSRESGVLPVLLTQPTLFGAGRDDVTGVDLETIDVGRARWLGEPGFNGAMAWALIEAYNDVTRAVARKRGIPLVDLARQLPKSSRFFYDRFHFTDDGAEAVADVVARELCPALSARFASQRTGDCGCVAPGE